MPDGERLEEISALATMIDENRHRYGLDLLSAWRALPGKDESLLVQGIEALGLVENRRKKLVPQDYIWRLPARYVGPYAERDAISTLLLQEDLDPILDRENTRAAYRLECADFADGAGNAVARDLYRSRCGRTSARPLAEQARCRAYRTVLRSSAVRSACTKFKAGSGWLTHLRSTSH